jgi:hypothetical protein
MQHAEQTPVLQVPAREDKAFASHEIAIATLKGRVAFDLQQNHIRESEDNVRWHINIHPPQIRRYLTACNVNPFISAGYLFTQAS